MPPKLSVQTVKEQQRIKELERRTEISRTPTRFKKVGIDFLREGARPPQAGGAPTSSPQIVQFIDQMPAQNHRVESICRVLTEQGVQVAPRAYRNWKSAPPSARAISDAYLTAALGDTVCEPE
ncbi:hypothetical protein QM797_22200 [Rhodococcus sp. IEGM 1381]|uniref:hypothetical protein n=1 Tax=Rhodococcus sp. IEGM 1381 TaxID=3047085 RepID=UPI0024B8642B|nr:hypothetical protein [Rhodococcus sp. IEGM 1381]MDI9897440.1 hypothetical protein [Rhodococcus sp. IEGM 1381]